MIWLTYYKKILDLYARTLFASHLQMIDIKLLFYLPMAFHNEMSSQLFLSVNVA